MYYSMLNVQQMNETTHDKSVPEVCNKKQMCILLATMVPGTCSYMYVCIVVYYIHGAPYIIIYILYQVMYNIFLKIHIFRSVSREAVLFC